MRDDSGGSPLAGEIERDPAALREELARLRGSIRYQAADIIAEAAASPRAWPKVPSRALALLADGRKRLRWRRLVQQLECGLPNDPLRTMASPDARAVRDLLRAAGAAGSGRSGRARYAPPSGLASTPAGDAVGRRLAELSKIIEAEPPFGPEPGVPPADLPGSGRRGIAYVAHTGIPDTTNGYARRTHMLAKAMNDAGRQTTVLLRGGTKGEASVIDGVSYMRIGPIEDSLSYHDYIGDYAAAVGEVVDEIGAAIVHAASNHVTGHAGLSAARQRSLPFVYEVRGLWQITRLATEPSYGRSVGFRAQRALEMSCALGADLVFANGEPLRRWFVQNGADETKFRDAPNGWHTDRRSPPDRARRRAAKAVFGLSPDQPVLGFVGSLTPYEGVGSVLDAARDLEKEGRPCGVLIVGDGPARPDLVRQAERNGLQNVVFTGRVAGGAASEAYEAIDIAPICRPRTAVGALVAPLKPLEALAAGSVVIVSRLPPLMPLIDAGAAIGVPPDDNGALVAALRQVLGDDEAMHKQAARGQDWVRANRAWDAVAQTMLAAYPEG